MVLDLVQVARMIKQAPCNPSTRNSIQFHVLDARRYRRVNEGVAPASIEYETLELKRVEYAHWDLVGTDFTFYVEPDCSALDNF